MFKLKANVFIFQLPYVEVFDQENVILPK